MVVMALKATLLKTSALVSSWSSNNRQRSRGNITRITEDNGRRGILLSTLLLVSQSNDSQSRLLQKYKMKSEENKVKNDKEDSYYKRNYKDYFEFVKGSLRQKTDEELNELEKGILKWLEANK